MQEREERQKKVQPKFAIKDHVRHITGIEAFVVDIALQAQVPVQVAPSPQNPNGQAMQLRNLPSPMYVLAYQDKNGICQILKSDEQFLEAVK